MCLYIYVQLCVLVFSLLRKIDLGFVTLICINRFYWLPIIWKRKHTLNKENSNRVLLQGGQLRGANDMHTKSKLTGSRIPVPLSFAINSLDFNGEVVDNLT